MHAGKTLVVSIDVCQRLAGIPLKLLAFEHLLNEYPVWRDRIVLVQVCTRPGTRQPDEEHSSSEIRQLVARINDRYGPVVDYRELAGNKVPLCQRLGLWRAGSVFFSSAVREGLNLFPLEFVYARTQLVDETDSLAAAATAAFVSGNSSTVGGVTASGFGNMSPTSANLGSSVNGSASRSTGGGSSLNGGSSGFASPLILSGTTTPNSYNQMYVTQIDRLTETDRPDRQTDPPHTLHQPTFYTHIFQ
jgi:trehalose 6-phosphate synthase/phosphatase